MLKHARVLCFFLCVFAAARFGSRDLRQASPVTGTELNRETIQVDRSVVVLGKLIGRKPSRSGQGSTLLLQDSQGAQFTAYIPPDIPPTPMDLGDLLEVTGTPLGLGVVSAKKLKVMKPGYSAKRITNVVVRKGFALVSYGVYTTDIPTNLPDGFYREVVVRVDAYGRRTLRAV